jgi:hypothetical protein
MGPGPRGQDMKHAASRTLFSYWNGLRGERTAPERSEIDPVAIRDVLADTFICEVDGDANHPFRLAGTRLCALFGREVKGLGLATLWGPSPSRGGAREAHALVETVLSEACGVVAGLRGTTRNLKALDIELLLLPLRHGGRTHSRILGCISAATSFPWAGLDPVVRLDLTTVRVIRGREAEAEADTLALTGTDAPLRQPEPRAERRGPFTVYPGGKSDGWSDGTPSS